LPSKLWVCFIHSVGGLNTTATTTFLSLRENSSFLTAFGLGHQLFLLPDSTWSIGASWVSVCWPLDWYPTIGTAGSQAFRFRLESHHQLSWDSNLPAHLADLGTSQPVLLMCQILLINNIIHLHPFYWYFKIASCYFLSIPLLFIQEDTLGSSWFLVFLFPSLGINCDVKHH
jgi:hypothetical protein